MFVNRKVCKDALEKKFEVNKLIDNSENELFICENLTPYNQRLVWMCRELERAKNIHNSRSSKGIIKFRRTMNEPPISVDHEPQIKALYRDFIFKERDRRS